MNQNIESPFTPSICNYCDDSPSSKKNNIQVEQLKKVNLNSIFNEINLPSSIDKNQIPNVSSSFIKTPNKNSNSQSKNLNNYNSTSLSYQYSNSGQKSNSFKNQINNRIENNKKENFIIQKNENINIGVNDHFNYNKLENEEFSTFSFEIKPQKRTPRNHTPENLLFKIESIPEEVFIPHQNVKEEKEKNNIKVNNGFKLIPLSHKSIFSANQLEKTKSKTNEIINKNITKNNSTNRKQKTSIPIFKTNFIDYMDIRKKVNINNNSKRKTKSNSNISRTSNSNSKSKTKKMFSKQENKNNFKPNSNNDINNIIQRHFQQYYLNSNQSSRRNSKNKSCHSSREKHKFSATSLTTYINKISKKNNFTLQKERKVKSFNNDRKNNTLKQENKLFYNTSGGNSKGKNPRQKVKTYINLSSILNNFPSNNNNKKNNNKSINCLSGILINSKNNIPNYKSNQNINIIESPHHEEEEQIFLPETKNSPGEKSYNSNIKTFHTQDTVYTTKENNINTNGTNTVNNTNNNIPTMRKPSPQVIKDFSFYKKKQVYRSNLISLVDNKENTQNNNYYLTNHSSNNQTNQFNIKYHESKKPIASIKLKRLNGDIDSNISDEYYNEIYK